MPTSPPNLNIHSRPLGLDPDTSAPRWWYGNDPVGTAVMNALSLTFPEGERFFIQAVKRFSNDLPPALARDVRAFTVQEGAHTREHMAFNALVARAGYDIAPIEALVQARLGKARERPEKLQLAATVALEHFTACFAHLALSDRTLLQGAPPELARLWEWHAVEEIEHKSVAFDVFMHATRDLSAWKRYAIRRWSMALATVLFLTVVRRASLMLLKQDGITGLSARIKLFRWLWGKPGLYRRILGEYFAFYGAGFHPWQVDDRHLIAETEARLVA